MLSALIGSIGIIFRWGWIPLIIVIVYSYWSESSASTHSLCSRVTDERSIFAVPQIILNVERGTARQSLSNEFVISTTFARLVLPVYFYGYSDNVLDVDVSRKLRSHRLVSFSAKLNELVSLSSMDLRLDPLLVPPSRRTSPPIPRISRRPFLPLPTNPRRTRSPPSPHLGLPPTTLGHQITRYRSLTPRGRETR